MFLSGDPLRFPKALGWVDGLTPTPLGTVEDSQHNRNALIINTESDSWEKEFTTNQFN